MRSITLTISKLYPDSVFSKTNGDVYEAWDKDGKAITVDKAAVDAEYAKQDYIEKRQYPEIGEQLDLLWHSIDADADLKTKFADFYTAIKAVKDANPKPS